MKTLLALLLLLIASPALAQTQGVTTTYVRTVTPVINTSAYAAGDCVGGLQTIANAVRTGGPGSGLIENFTVLDATGANAAIDIVFFSANPTNSTFTNNAACAVNAADLGKIVGYMSATQCRNVGTPGVCQQAGPPLGFNLGINNSTIYAVMIAVGTPTYASIGVLQDRVSFLGD